MILRRVRPPISQALETRPGPDTRPKQRAVPRIGTRTPSSNAYTALNEFKEHSPDRMPGPGNAALSLWCPENAPVRFRYGP